MRILATVCSKGGVGKTTATANLGGLLADAGYRVLLIDLDSQPTLSSYYDLSQPAPGGVYELLATELIDLDRIISRTSLPNLDIIVSNDHRSQLQQLLLNAPNGRFRLIELLDRFADRYDAVLIDTQGARSILLEMAVLAADHLVSPIVPELLTAREFVRGTQGMLDELRELAKYTRFEVPLVSILLNKMTDQLRDARDISKSIRSMYADVDDRPAHSLRRTRHPMNQEASMALVFPRLARNFAKNGYYPTDEATLERVLNALAASHNQRVRILDPCAGAILETAHRLGRERTDAYGVEFDVERTRHMQRVVDFVIQSDLMDTVISPRSFGLLFFNPPYGDLVSETGGSGKGYAGKGRQRLEKLFYQRSVHHLQYGEVMVMIVPTYVFDDELSGWVAQHFDCISVYRAAVDTFQQVILFGTRTKRNALLANGKTKETKALL